MNRRNALALLGALPFSSAAGADTWPTKPVRIVVPFGPGGSGDIVSRIVGHELEKRAGQPFIIENKPGATAMVGTAIVKNAPADGYTLLHGSTSSRAANPSLYKQMTYDPDEFTTIAVDGTIPCFMLVAKDAPYKSVKEFVAWAKARKEPIFSGYGNTSSRVPSALFDVQSGVRLEEVAYKDAVPAIQDLIGGRIHVTFPDLVIGETYVRSGQVRALAVTSPQRAPQFPETEAMAETYPGFEVVAFLSFTVRKEVPVEIQRKLNGWVMEILHLTEVHKRLLEIGITPPPRDWDIAQSDAFVKRERVQWAKYIKLAKIEPQ
jgi:tripartite-type tricarboxylate transporter receptor subunit TctC